MEDRELFEAFLISAAVLKETEVWDLIAIHAQSGIWIIKLKLITDCFECWPKNFLQKCDLQLLRLKMQN